jgi:hypothetical protein
LLESTIYPFVSCNRKHILYIWAFNILIGPPIPEIYTDSHKEARSIGLFEALIERGLGVGGEVIKTGLGMGNKALSNFRKEFTSLLLH